MRILNFCVA